METRKKKTKLWISLLALALLLVYALTGMAGILEPFAPPGPTMRTLDEVEPRIPIHKDDLPLTITEPNSYYLVEDVNFTDDANHAITIECNDVTIDLMGYTLKGPDTGNKSGIEIKVCSNVEICNGTIRDFGDNAISAVSSSRGHRVTNIRALSNDSGIVLSINGLVKDCTAAANANCGIDVGGGSTVIGNTSYRNGYKGIYGSGGSTVTGNTCYDNGTYGIETFDGCTVTGNTSYSNGTDGIYTNNGCTVTGNTCYNNDEMGIYANNGGTVTGNTCYDNNDSGIWVYRGNTVIGNTVRNNTNYGIKTDDYCLIDQNVAFNNGTNMSTGTTGCQVGMNVAP